MSTLSSLHRSSILDQLAQKNYDLAIIGGGITGAGIALDAASRGLSVALVEKNDFASGTSSRSTKLIHGGLRYLKQLEIGLVREVGRERAIVHDLAPHLVTAEKMLLPLVEGGTFGKLATSFGLKVYDFLAGVEGDDRRKMLSKEETLAMEPLLREDIVVGGGIYAEYRTDDARLTIEIIKAAASYGALSINYVMANDFVYTNGKVSGIQCTDLHSGNTLNIRAKHVISAAGPWVDQLRKKNHSLSDKHLFLTKGVHLVVPHHRLPVRQATYFDVADGRMIFAIPRHTITYIGTTDTPYQGDINHVTTNHTDASYLLNAVNEMFPSVQLRTSDIESSWAGLRPLIFEESKSASELSRKDEIFESDSGLLSIAGGKLTGYRKMAERIIDKVIEKIEVQENRAFKDCHTENIPLSGGAFDDAVAVNSYISKITKLLEEQGLIEKQARYLVANYGDQADTIIQNINRYNTSPEIALAQAELYFCIHQELCLRPLDFFSRRTGRLYFDIQSIELVRAAVMQDFATTFDWSSEAVDRANAELDQAIHNATSFSNSPSS